MKTGILKLGVALFILVFAGSVKAGNNCVIKPVVPSDLAQGVVRAWELSYLPDKDPIVVELYESRKCVTYVVRSNYFEVAYESGNKGFGARMVKPAESKIPDILTSQVISPAELEKQRILSAETVDQATAVELIANYLPDLVNPAYQSIFTN